jgi:enterochelin esterase family protein
MNAHTLRGLPSGSSVRAGSFFSQRFAALFSLLTLLVCYPAAQAADDYKLGPDSMPQDGVPRGDLIKMPPFTNSTVYPGTQRDWWVYVPKQYDAATAACLMIFQDGWNYANPTGQFRASIVFDNLIHKKEMPVTIGIFINPGTVPPAEPGERSRSNRSFEYDSLGDQFARFLLEEVLPEVAKNYHLSKDPEGRAICGISSGGICAWTVAWERPNEFRKVLSHVGSFTNIRGGHNYQAWIRKTEKKPIRVFLQDGANDLDNLHGSWPLSNHEMAASLKFKGYDYKFEFGTEGHNGKHGAAILPDSLRWLWRDYKP